MMIGIAGGTGSGKTTVAHRIIQSVGASSVVYLQQDSYYRNLGDMPVELRHRVNFDHPDAFDIVLLINHIEALRAGEAIEQPLYDYKTHSRKTEVTHVEPSKRYADVIIPEGGFNPVSIDLVTGKIKAILAAGSVDAPRVDSTGGIAIN